MRGYAVLDDDLDAGAWEIVTNRLEEFISGLRGGDPEAPTVAVGGQTVLAKHLVDVTGEPIQLLMQVEWYRPVPDSQWRLWSDMDLKILNVELLEPTATVYLLDHPDDPIDPGFTWQDVFADDPKDWAKEALLDVEDELEYEVAL